MSLHRLALLFMGLSRQNVYLLNNAWRADNILTGEAIAHISLCAPTSTPNPTPIPDTHSVIPTCVIARHKCLISLRRNTEAVTKHVVLMFLLIIWRTVPHITYFNERAHALPSMNAVNAKALHCALTRYMPSGSLPRNEQKALLTN